MTPQAADQPAPNVRDARKHRYRILAVRRPPGWQPAGWWEEPEAVEVLKTIDRRLKRRRAENIAMGFNASSMAKGGRRWAVIRPEVG